MIIEGTLALQISKETVPDFETTVLTQLNILDENDTVLDTVSNQLNLWLDTTQLHGTTISNATQFSEGNGLQTWIDLRGRRGAEKTLVIRANCAHLIHLNRMPGSNSEKFPLDMIHR